MVQQRCTSLEKNPPSVTELLRLNCSIDVGLVCKSLTRLESVRPNSRRAIPFRHWHRPGEIIETKIDFRKHLGHEDDLAGVHRNGKQNLNRFPFFCLRD